MTKKKHNSLSGWKPLKLEGSVFSSNVEDLIGIEELTEYKLEKETNRTKIVICNEESSNKKDKVNF